MRSVSFRRARQVRVVFQLGDFEVLDLVFGVIVRPVAIAIAVCLSGIRNGRSFDASPDGCVCPLDCSFDILRSSKTIFANSACSSIERRI